MMSGTETAAAVAMRLRARLMQDMADVVRVIGDAPYALIDFPDHPNVGDSAIWMGTRAWTEAALGRAPALVAPMADGLAGLEAVDGAVLLHGGGNFGDVWPAHQDYRIAVLDARKGRPVIQMPQSIHFAEPARIDATARAIDAHGAFTLLVRDRESLALAEARFPCDVRLCPDMAFGMGPLRRRGAADLDVLLVLRTDHERVTESAGRLPPGWLLTDWMEDTPGLYDRITRQTRIGALLSLNPRELSRAARARRFYDAIAEERVERGLRLLSRARFVITDRLHVHILSTLLGIPHVFLDNSYGKIRRLSQAFGTAWQGATAARTLDEARDIAQRHLVEAM